MLSKLYLSKGSLNVIYWLSGLLLLTQDVGSFGTRLPILQYVILALFGILLIKNLIKERTLVFPLSLLVLIGYITVITILNSFDMDGITDMLFFFISLLTIYWVVKDLGDMKIIYKMFYNVAVIMSVIAIFQFISYLLGISSFYELGQYGFQHRVYIRNDLLAVSGLYSEPSHTAPIIAIALLVALIGKSQQFDFVKTWKTIMLIIFTVLTQSTIAYFSVFSVFLIYIFVFQKNFSKKLKYIFAGVFCIVFVILVNPDFIVGVLSRLNQFETISTTTANDLSALALVSNFRIALEKMKDGYILGTGFDTHRLYYDKYIAELYGKLYMNLNSDDAASLYTRVFSEFGIVGFVIFILSIVFKFYKSLKFKNIEKSVWLLLFLVVIVRNGHYIHICMLFSFILAFFKFGKNDEIKIQKI